VCTVVSDATELQEACGANGPIRLGVAYPGTGATEYSDIHSAFALIGRDPACDLLLDHEEVDNRHAYLQVMAGRVFCVDLRSRSGTYWENGSEGSGWLDSDEAIRIGPYQIRLADVGPGTTNQSRHGNPSCPLQALPREQDTLPGLVLDFQKGSTESLHWRMKQVLVLLGKSSRCKVRLGGPGVLSFHASLLRTPQGVWIIDLGGGTQVNGSPVRFVRLEHHDQIQIGTFCMRVGFELPRSSVPARSQESGVRGQELMIRSQGAKMLPRQVLSHPVAVKQPPGALTETAPPNLPWLGPWQNPSQNQLAPSEPYLFQVLGQIGLMQQQMMAQQQQTMTLLCQLLGPLLKGRQGGTIGEEIERLQQVTQELQAVQSQLATPATPPPSQPPRAEPRGEASRPERPTRAATKETSPAGNGQPVFDSATAPPPDAGRAHSWLIERMATLQNEQQTRWQRLLHQVRTVLLGAKE
jgi:pSer/pThr/pTyr-binding forkhead associated (FHA) protein